MVWNRQEPQVPAPATEKRPKILVGTPYESKAYTWWALNMLGPLHVPVPWAEKTFTMIRGVPIPVARDQIVEAALADPAVTHIMWVDSDNVCVKPPNPNDAMQMLYACDQPIVSGLYRAKQREGFNYAMWMDAKLPDGKPGFLPIKSFTGNWLQVDVVGHGFCLVRREVYEKLSRPWYPWHTQKPSEDFNFCIAARKAGYPINVFTDVQLRHLGDLCVNPDGTIQVLEV